MLERMMRAATEDAFELFRSLYYDTTLSTNPTVLSALQRLVPASRLLIGTDYPFAQEIGVRYALDGLAAYEGFGEAERAMIESGTALVLCHRLEPGGLESPAVSERVARHEERSMDET